VRDEEDIVAVFHGSGMIKGSADGPKGHRFNTFSARRGLSGSLPGCQLDWVLTLDFSDSQTAKDTVIHLSYPSINLDLASRECKQGGLTCTA
jgi:hypothetical protein